MNRKTTRYRSCSLSRALVLCCCVAASSWSSPLLGGWADWVSFRNESASRISAATSVGLTDEEEKDLISGDVDKDGDIDLIVVRKEPFSVVGGRRNVLFMNEAGVLTDRTATLAPDFLDLTDDRDVVLVDVDGDTWLDIVTAGTFDEPPRVLMNLGESVGVWQGFDYVAADNRMPPFAVGPQFCALAFGDVTGDLSPDLYFSDYDNTLEDRLLINDGSGFFTDETDSRLTPAMSNSVFGTDSHIVDVNNDGFQDIFKNNASGSSPPPGFDPETSVFYNDGTGHFSVMETVYDGAPYMIEPADFTQDGFVDLYIVDDGQDRYLTSDGNGGDGFANFTEHTVTSSPSTAFFGGNVKFADIDHDGILDVLVADVDTDLGGCDRKATILRGVGTPPNITYSDPFLGTSRPWLPNGTFDIEAFDINGDGVLDLWIGTCAGSLVMIGEGQLFADGFESGSTTEWSGTTP